MSCCCCGELLEGIRKEQLVRREEEQEQEEQSRRNMDISLLREQYRCTRETQRRHTHVLLLRTVSEVVVSVSQGFTSPPAVTFDPDPWRVHLELHRRCCPGVTDSSSRRSSSSSDSRKLSSCSSFCSTTEEVNADGSSGGDPGPGSSDGSRRDPEKTDPVQVSVSDSLGSRKLSASALRFTRQLSLGGVGSSTRVHQNQTQNQSYHPFPNRKTPRISESARRLGMYSSF
ncbi:uncharacterized protein PEZ65_016808 [Lycodopsis pacificus]